VQLFNVLITKPSSLIIILFWGCSHLALAESGFPYDFSDVNFVHEDISSWKATNELDMSVDESFITLDYDKKNIWPARTSPLCSGCNANPWVVVDFKGEWWAATFDWFRFGQTAKPIRSLHGNQINDGPFGNTWEPVEGETYGFFVSGLARFPTTVMPGNVQERTNVVLYKWGEGVVKVIPLDEPEEMCVPIKSKEGKIATICL